MVVRRADYEVTALDLAKSMSGEDFYCVVTVVLIDIFLVVKWIAALVQIILKNYNFYTVNTTVVRNV